jgi:cytochrome P450
MTEINFFSEDLQNDPFEYYQHLREQAPVYRDSMTGIYHVSTFDDVRHVLQNPKLFSGQTRSARDTGSPRQHRVNQLFKDKGWLPASTLIGRDDPNHKQMRALFNEAFRPAKIEAMDAFVQETAEALFEPIAASGHCDWVQAMAVPLPLTIIVKQMGAPASDLWQIKSWTDAFFKRISMMLTEEEEIECIEKEIEAQHYFQPIFDRLRAEPDDTLLSDLVNKPIPEWGRTLTDEELHAEMMADTFVGGSETTTNALSAGIKLLIENPSVWDQLKADQDATLRPFIEEVLRLESPVQMLLRRATAETHIGDTLIPEGALIGVRYGAANRDQQQFSCPADIDLARKKPGAHLAFGSGIHHCLGAPLARRELWWGFKTFLDRVEQARFTPGENDFTYQPHCLLRALKTLSIDLDLKDGTIDQP